MWLFCNIDRSIRIALCVSKVYITICAGDFSVSFSSSHYKIAHVILGHLSLVVRFGYCRSTNFLANGYARLSMGLRPYEEGSICAEVIAPYSQLSACNKINQTRLVHKILYMVKFPLEYWKEKSANGCLVMKSKLSTN